MFAHRRRRPARGRLPDRLHRLLHERSVLVRHGLHVPRPRRRRRRSTACACTATAPRPASAAQAERASSTSPAPSTTTTRRRRWSTASTSPPASRRLNARGRAVPRRPPRLRLPAAPGLRQVGDAVPGCRQTGSPTCSASCDHSSPIKSSSKLPRTTCGPRGPSRGALPGRLARPDARAEPRRLDTTDGGSTPGRGGTYVDEIAPHLVRSDPAGGAGRRDADRQIVDNRLEPMDSTGVDHLPARLEGTHRHRPAHDCHRSEHHRLGLLPPQGHRLGAAPACLHRPCVGLSVHRQPSPTCHPCLGGRAASVAVAARPVRRAEVLLEDLAGRVARQRVDQSTVVGHLKRARRSRAKSMSSCSSGRSLARRRPTTTAFTVSPHRSSGHADHRDVGDRRVAHQDVLDLGRVDVLAARRRSCP